MVLSALQKIISIICLNQIRKLLKINELYSSGNYIVIFTSRYMGRSKERPAIAKKRGFKFTQKQLKTWGVKFDKL